MKNGERNFGVIPWLLAISAIVVLGLAGCSGGGGGSVNNEPPTLTVPAAQTVVQGKALTFTVVGKNPDLDVPLTYTVSGEPKGVTLNASTGAFSWTPTFDEIGTHMLKFTVSNGVFFTSKTVQVRVTPDTAVDTTVALPGGTLDPLAIPKYVTPLFILPVMNNNGTADNYAVSMRQFKQQILPGGIWGSLTGRLDAFPATTVQGYGPNTDPAPDSTAIGGGAGIAPAANSQFHYPAYTIETRADTQVKVRWINDLVDADGNFLPPLTTVDQNLHWANPTQVCAEGQTKTDCMGMNPAPYTGPVPTVIHLHGAHVAGHSDGYPEA